MVFFTTSSPTPRPDTSVTAFAVEKPGAKISEKELPVGGRCIRLEKPLFHGLGPDGFPVDPGAVVRYLNEHICSGMGP